MPSEALTVAAEPAAVKECLEVFPRDPSNCSKLEKLLKQGVER